MKIANEEIRTIVVKAYLSGSASRQQLSEIFGYTPASISNWVRAYKQEQRLSPRPSGHDALVKGIAAALDLVCASDAKGWFKNCGVK